VRNGNPEQILPFGESACFSADQNRIKTLSETTIGVVPSSEEQIPQVVGKTEKTRNGMD